jgi:NAD(P)H-hydrate epimerase
VINIMIAQQGFRKMKLPPLSRQQVRQVDQIAIEEYGVPGVVLMENAGRGAAAIINRVAESGPIAILCGSGNNAGDGYVIARHLQLAEREVRIISIVDLRALHGDARINAEIAEKSNIDIRLAVDRQQIEESLADATTVVDGLLGTGARGPLRGMFAVAVAAANDCPALRIALDIPTGLDCDSGEISEPTFRADHTITFVAAKLGFGRGDSAPYIGTIHVVGIGAPKKLMDDLRRKWE